MGGEACSLDVTEIATGKVVHSVNVSDQTERGVQRVLSGMLMQIDTTRYFVAERVAASPAVVPDDDAAGATS